MVRNRDGFFAEKADFGPFWPLGRSPAVVVVVREHSSDLRPERGFLSAEVGFSVTC